MRYSYQAVDTDSQKLKGTVDARSDSDAVRILEGRGLIPIRVQTENNEDSGQISKISRQELHVTLFEVVILLRSGVAISDAVESQSRSAAAPSLRNFYHKISTALHAGNSFSSALSESSDILPAYVFQLVKAGEMTGNLAESLADAVAQMAYEESIANELRNAMVYPAILVATGISAVAILFTVVVPKFSNLLDKGADLPLLAYIVLSAGSWCHDNGVLMLIILAGLVTAAIVAGRSPKSKGWAIDWASRLPLISNWLVEADTARWAKILGILLANRVALVAALELAQTGVGIKQRLLKLKLVSDAVIRGEALSSALLQNEAVSSSAHNLILVGERAGRLPEVLGAVAALYDEMMRNRMKRLLALIEPLAILIIGAFVGLIIIGIILAITSANEVGI